MDPIRFAGVADFAAEGTLADRPPACLNLVWAGFLQTDVFPNQVFWCLRTGPGETDFAWFNVTNSGGGGASETFTVPFTFASGTIALHAVTTGSLVYRAAILIETPFSDPAARVLFGLASAPGLIWPASPDSATANVANTYDNEAMYLIGGPDALVLTIQPGASIAGSGLLLYSLR